MKNKKSDLYWYYGIKILAWTIRLLLVAFMFIWLVATANWEWISWIPLFILSSCVIVLDRMKLD